MGIRIHKAIGYGMSWEVFCQHTLLYKDDVEESLYAAFEISELRVPKQRFFPNRYPILDTNLLSRKFRKDDNGSGQDLFQLVSDCDNKDNIIIFFPNLEYSHRWYRRDDDIDYAFAVLGDASASPSHSVKFLEKGLYPFQQIFMKFDGTPAQADKSENLLPDIPSEIRWYLDHLHVLTEEGINLLRPCMAEWWC